MNVTYFIIPFLVPVISGVLIVIISWCFIRIDIRKFIDSWALRANDKTGAKEDVLPESQTAFTDVSKEERSTLLQLRLQANERLIVFIDRINPANLFLRLHQPGITSREFQSLILNEVRSEYQHNVSQQLYLSSANWIVLSKLKEDTLAMINNAVAALPAESTGVDLSKMVLEHVAVMSENPYDLTISLLKQDIHQLF